MVGIVTSNGAGLTGSSKDVLGNGGQIGVGGLGQAGGQAYVNAKTGNLILQQADEILAGRGPDIGVVRTYNSQGGFDFDNGDSWQLSLYRKLYNLTGTANTAGSSITRQGADGAIQTYTYDSTSGKYIHKDGSGAYDTLGYTAGSNSWTWTDGDSGLTETYGVSPTTGEWRINSVADRDGNALTYAYDANGLISTVTDADGEVTQLIYNAAKQLLSIETITDGVTQTCVRYSYDTQGRLSQVTIDLTPDDDSIADGNVYTTTYTYDGTSDRIASLLNGDGTTLGFGYTLIDGSYYITTITNGQGLVSQYSYSGTDHDVAQTASSDPTVLSTTDTQVVTTSASLSSGSLTTPVVGWSGASLRENLSADNAQTPQIVYAQNGNGIATWRLGADIYASVYSKASDSWTAPVSLARGGTSVPQVSMSANGNGLVTWLQSNSIYACRYINGAWESAALLENSGGVAANPVGAINDNGRAVVAFIQNLSNTYNLQVNLFDGSAWQAAATNLDDRGGVNTNQLSTSLFPSVAIDDQNNAIVAWQQKLGTEAVNSLLFARYSASNGTWSNADSTTIESSTTAVSASAVVFDANGDGVISWLQGSTLYAKRYSQSSATWEAAVVLTSNATAGVTVPALSMSSNGNAIISWNEGSNIYAWRYHSGAWVGSGAELIASLSGTSAYPAVSINDNGQAVVAFEQTDSTTYNLYVVRYTGGGWTPSALLENNTTSVNPPPSIAIDGNGNINALWVQKTTASSLADVYSNRYNAETALYYTIPAGATWSSITQALYGTTDANFVNALQSALGNPALVAGNRLSGMPATLNYNTNTTVSVPAYYNVQAGDTWVSITQTIYGVNAAAAVQALETALGNPTLTTGLHLTGLPSSLNYTLSGPSTTNVQLTDALGNQTDITSDAQGRLIQIQQPSIGGERSSVSYAYDAQGNVLSSTDSLGQTTTYAYDSHGNRIRQQDGAGNVIERTYNSANQITNQTVYVIADPDGSGALSASQPQTTNYYYDTNQNLRFIVSPEGRVTEYRYDAHGQQINSLTYTAATYSTSGSAPTTTDLTTWAAAQDQTQLERIDTSYDARGLVSSVTQYTATDSSGNGINNGSQSTTQYVYDAAGRLLQKIAPPGVATTGIANDYATHYTYDGLGRQISVTKYDATGSGSTQTLTTYYDAQHQVQVQLANGLTRISTYDARGLLVSQVDQTSLGAVLSTETYQYDADGRLRITTDPDGDKTYLLYDSNGNVTGSIDATGAFTENVYNKDGQVIRTIRYATPVSANLTTLFAADGNGNIANVAITAVRPTSNAADRYSFQLYDAAGRVVKTIDALGEVTEYRYDGASQLIETIQYANRLSSAQLSALETASTEVLPTNANATPVADPVNDRVTRQFYSADGLLLASLDSGGYLTEHTYNAAGQLTSTLHYAAATQTSLRASGTLADLKTGLASAQDQAEQFAYNDAGQLIADLDAEGYLTTYAYDTAGHCIQTYRYATRANSFTPPATRAEDQISQSQYDAQNRLISTHSLPGDVTTLYSYDSVGNLIQTVTAVGSPEQQTQTQRYDLQGRLIGELSGAGSAALLALGSAPTQAQINAVWTSYGTQYAYDAAGRRISTTVPDGSGGPGHTTLFYYDADGHLTYSINALGEVAGYTYDAFGGLVKTTQYATRLGGIALAGLTGGTDSALGTVVTSLASAFDRITQTAYDQDGNAISLTDALGNLSTRSYDSFGELIRRVDASVVSQYAYDARGLLTQTTADVGGLNRITSATYDAFGRVLTQTDGLGNTTAYAYDKLGHEVTVISALSAAQSTTYDAFGRTLTQTDALGHTTTYTYDSADRSITITTPEGISTTTLKNRQGQTVTVVDGRGNSTTYSYNLDGQVTRVTTPAGTVTDDYDTAGQLIETTDARGTVTTYTYDAAGRTLTRTLDPTGLALKTTYAYDAFGDVIWAQDANGVWTRTDYDANGQVKAVTVDPSQVPDSSGNLVANAAGLNLQTAYTYDALGHTLTVTTAAGTQSARTTCYTYDHLGRRTQESVDPNGLNLISQYAYDADDNVVATTDALSNVTRYTYNADGRLIYTVDALGDVSKHLYDANGELLQTTAYAIPVSLAGLPVGASSAQVTALIASSANDQITRYGYDKDGRLVVTLDALGDATQRSYDANGNVTSVTRYATAYTGVLTPNVVPAFVTSANDQTTNTVYDSADRAIQVTDALDHVTTYSYDAGSNLTDKTVADGTPDAVTTHYAYDAAGRMTDETDAWGASAATTTHYVYDDLGQVTEQTVAAGTAAATTTHYVYDAAGRQTAKTTAYGEPEAATTQTVYDAAGNAVEIIDPNGNVGYFWFDAAGRNTLHVDPEGYATATQYTATGEVKQITRYAQKLIGPFSVDTSPTPVATTGQDQITTLKHDVLGRQTQLIDADGYAETTAYDAFGNKASFTNKLGGVFTYSYDKLDRVLTETQPVTSANGSGTQAPVVTSYAYDARGNKIEQIEAVGLPEQRITTWTYDTLDHVLTQSGEAVSVYDPVTGTSTLQTPTETHTYDARGNVILSVDPNGAKTYTYYDALDRKSATLDADGDLSTWTYNTAGDVVTTDLYADALSLPASPGGTAPTPLDATNVRETRYVYDGNHNLIAATTPSVRVGSQNPATGAFEVSTQDLTVTQVYDHNGNVIEGTDALGNSTYSYYDALGNRILQVDAAGYVTAWTYDLNGNVTQDTAYANALSGGVTPTTNSTVASLLSAVTPSSDDRISLFAYDQMNRVIQTQSLNVTTGSVNGTTGQLTEATATATTTCVYDGLGNVVEQTDATGAVDNWAFDLIGRQIEHQGATFTDNLGNPVRPTTDTEYNGLGEVTRSIDRGTNNNTETDDHITRYTYTKNGYQLSQTDPTGAVTSFLVSATGQITRKSINRGTAAGAQLTDATDYVYDLKGQQVKQKTLAGPQGGSLSEVQTQETQYDAYGDITGKRTYVGTAPTGINAWQEFAEYDHAGRLVRGNSDNGITQVYIRDGNGNATMTLDSAGADLRSVDITDLSALVQRTDVNATIAAYDQRNQLTDSWQPSMTEVRNNLVIEQYTGVAISGLDPWVNIGSAYGLGDAYDKTDPVTQGAIGFPSAATLSITGQSANTNRLILMYRTAGTTNGWSSVVVPQKIQGGGAVAGSFESAWSSLGLAAGNYEFNYYALDASGDVLNSQVGQMTLGGSSTAFQVAAQIGGAGHAFFDAAGNINLTEMGSNAQTLSFSYRIAGTSTWTTTTLTPATIAGTTTPGWFKFSMAGLAQGDYEYTLDVMDSASNVLRTTGSTFTLGASMADSRIQEPDGAAQQTTPITTVTVGGSSTITSSATFTRNLVAGSVVIGHSEGDDIDAAGLVPQSEQLYLTLPNTDAWGTGSLRIAVSLGATTETRFLSEGDVSTLTALSGYSGNLYAANGQTSVSLAIPETGGFRVDYPSISYGGLSYAIYKQTPSGEILLGSYSGVSGSGTLQIYDDGNDQPHYVFEPSQTFSVSNTLSVGKNLIAFNPASTSADRVVMEYRPANSTGGWSVMTLTKSNGVFGFDWSNATTWPRGSYTYRAVTLDASGNILNTGTGSFTVPTSGNPTTTYTALPDNGVGNAFIGTDGNLNITEQSGAQSLVVRLRTANSSDAWSAPITLTTALVNGQLMPGWFSFNPADYGFSGDCEYTVEARDGSNALLGRSAGNFTVGVPNSVSALQGYTPSGALLRFNSPPQTPDQFNVAYRLAGSGDVWSTPIALTQAADGYYTWDTSTIYSGSTAADYEYQYTATDAQGIVLKSGNGVVRLGASPSILGMGTATTVSQSGIANGATPVIDNPSVSASTSVTAGGSSTITSSATFTRNLVAGSVVIGHSEGDDIDAAGLVPQSEQLYLTLPNTDAWGTGSLRIAVSLGATTETRFLSEGDVSTLTALSGYSGNLYAANGQTSVSLAIPETGGFRVDYPSISYGGLSYAIYKQTPSGEILLGSYSGVSGSGTLQIYDDGNDQPHYVFEPSQTFSVSNTLSVGKNLIAFNPASTSADRVVMEYRPANSTGGWSVMTLTKSNGVFGFDWSNATTWPRGSYTYRAVTLDASGNILNTGTGSFTVPTSGNPTINYTAGQSGGAGRAFMEPSGKIDFTEQAGAQTLTIKYRLAGTTDWSSTVVLHPATLAGELTPGWFVFDPTAQGLAAGNYEYSLQAANSGGTTVNRASGTFTVGNPSSVVLNGYQADTAFIQFADQPTGTTQLKISYRIAGSADVWATTTLTPNADGQYDWNVSGIYNGVSPLTYEYKYEAWSDTALLNQAHGDVSLGTTPSLLSYTIDGLPTQVTFTIPVTDETNNATQMALQYRPQGSTGGYSSIVLTRASSAESFVWDASSVVPSGTSASIDYIYTLLDTNGTPILRPDNQSYTVAGLLQIGTATNSNSLEWVIADSTTETTTIHRSQVTNAFGEVVQETDGLGHITDYQYNTLGKMVQKQDPTTTVTLANGYQEQARPTTTYYYDLDGRLVGVRDPNGNLNTQILRAGDPNGSVLFEFHPDGGIKQTTYDVFGNVRAVIDELDQRTDYSYDADNRLTRIDRPQRDSGPRGYDTYQYDAEGNRIAHTTTPDGSELDRDTTTYDALGRVTQTVSAQGRAYDYSYAYIANLVGIGGNLIGGWEKTELDPNGMTMIDDTDLFGRQIQHTDLGGHVFNYSYNNAGWLISQTGSTGENISYSYYSNGYLQRIDDAVSGSRSEYAYDANGNRTYEGYSQLVNGQREYYENATISYDELNRVQEAVDSRADIRYEYDADGNKRHVWSYYHDGIGGNMQVEDDWYLYDSMNRFTTTMGTLVNGRATSADDITHYIARGSSGDGVDIAYDLAGNRREAIYASDGHREDYTYTADGYLQNVYINSDASSQGILRATRSSDLLGRVTTYREYNSSGALDSTQTSVYDKDSKLTQETTDGVTTYNTLLADGTLDHTSQTQNGTTITTYYGYEWWDSAKQSTITEQPYNASAPGWESGVSHFTYDANGHLAAAIDETGNRSFEYVTNAEGLILQRHEMAGSNVDKTHDYYYVNGQRIGDVGNDGDADVDYAQALATPQQSREDLYKHWQPISSADFDQNFEPISPAYPGSSPGQYTVKTGDTLQSIAAAVWGDGSLWYLIADANGLSSGATLTADQVLTLPDKVTNIHNSASTFKPYNPGEAIGDVSPTLPEAPPPPVASGGGCGGAMIIVMIVAIVAACFIGPEVLMALTGEATGAAALAAAGPLAMATAGAITGAAASVISQGVGIAIGAQQSFSWKGVAMGALGGAVTAGITGTIPGISGVSSAGMGISISGNAFAQGMVNGAIGSVITQGIGVATGLQNKFSWASVAAAGVSSGVGRATSGWGDFGSTMASGFAGGFTEDELSGTKPNWGSIAADTFGSWLGGEIGGSLSAQRQAALAAANTGGQTGSVDTNTVVANDAGSGAKIKQADVAGFLRGSSAGLANAEDNSDITYISPFKAITDGPRVTRITDAGSGDDSGGGNGVSNDASISDNSNVVTLPPVPVTAPSAAPDLSALRDPATLADSGKLLSINNSLLNYLDNKISGLNPVDTSEAIANTYSSMFQHDTTAVWMGLAPYAVSKVGQLYSNVSWGEIGGQFLNSIEASGSDYLPSSAQIGQGGNEAIAQALISTKGVYDGNTGIYRSMAAAEMVYQAGGTDAIRAMLNAGITFGGVSPSADGTDKGKNSLLDYFTLRDQAKDLSAQGQTDEANKTLGLALRASADFEQRYVLQQYYDKSYTVDVEGTSYTNTLRGALNYFTNSAKSIFPESFANSFSAVTVLGKTETFSGTDIGDVNQRMPLLVYPLADDLMDAYKNNLNGLTGPERIFQDQQQLIQHTYSTLLP